MVVIIYLLTHKNTGKKYVGAAKVTLGQIAYRYRTSARRYGGSDNHPIYRDIAIYGYDSFTLTKIEDVDPDLFHERIDFWANHFDTYEPHGYNHHLTPEQEKD